MDQENIKILEEFYNLQSKADGGLFNKDQMPLMSYARLIQRTGMDRKELKRRMMELRDKGLIQLEMVVKDVYYIPIGSGYMLTEKGLRAVKKLLE